jgi:hypothetical protein
LFAKIWIDYFIFRIKKFEVDKRPPGLLLDWLITNKQDPPTYRGGKREESGCETCAVKCIVHPMYVRHPNASYQKKEVSTGIPGFKIFFVSCLVDQKPVVGFIDVISQFKGFN